MDSVNVLVNGFIVGGYVVRVIVVEWKDSFNEVWVDLLELLDTRG